MPRPAIPIYQHIIHIILLSCLVYAVYLYLAIADLDRQIEQRLADQRNEETLEIPTPTATKIMLTKTVYPAEAATVHDERLSYAPGVRNRNVSRTTWLEVLARTEGEVFFLQ